MAHLIGDYPLSRSVMAGYTAVMHVMIPISKFWVPMSVSACVCCSIFLAQSLQTQQTPPLLRGFDKVQWDRVRPEGFVPLIERKLSKHSRADVTALLGTPNQSSPAGKGMFGPYQAYYSYILNCEKSQDGVWQNGYVWDTLDVSFTPDNVVSKIEIRSHAY